MYTAMCRETADGDLTSAFVTYAAVATPITEHAPFQEWLHIRSFEVIFVIMRK